MYDNAVQDFGQGMAVHQQDKSQGYSMAASELVQENSTGTTPKKKAPAGLKKKLKSSVARADAALG